jgi:hypothetical protein
MNKSTLDENINSKDDTSPKKKKKFKLGQDLDLMDLIQNLSETIDQPLKKLTSEGKQQCFKTEIFSN